MMGYRVLAAGLFSVCALVVFAQTAPSPAGGGMTPRELLRPRHGEEPRFPKDYVIGELGRGDASEESYQTAKRIMTSLAGGSGTTALAVFPEKKRLSVLESIKPLGVRTWRIGGGRNESDGSVSYLVRFLGREKSITGELYLRKEEPKPAKTEAPAGTAPAEEGSAEPAESLDTQIAAADAAGKSTDGVPGGAAVPAVRPAPGPAVPAADTGTADAGQSPAENPAENAPRWRVDDLLLEQPRSLAEGKYSPGGADMTPYERFF